MKITACGLFSQQMSMRAAHNARMKIVVVGRRSSIFTLDTKYVMTCGHHGWMHGRPSPPTPSPGPEGTPGRRGSSMVLSQQDTKNGYEVHHNGTKGRIGEKEPSTNTTRINGWGLASS